MFVYIGADERLAVYIFSHFKMNNTLYMKTERGKGKNRNQHETQPKHRDLSSAAEIIISNKYVNVKCSHCLSF